MRNTLPASRSASSWICVPRSNPRSCMRPDVAHRRRKPRQQVRDRNSKSQADLGMETTPSNSAPEFIMNVDGASPVAHQTVLIISDTSDCARSITSKWQSERNSPTFLTNHLHLQPDSFDLAIIGTTNASVFDLVQSFAKPVIHVSRVNGEASKLSRVIHIPEVDGWPELAITLAKQILEHQKSASDLAQLS